MIQKPEASLPETGYDIHTCHRRLSRTVGYSRRAVGADRGMTPSLTSLDSPSSPPPRGQEGPRVIRRAICPSGTPTRQDADGERADCLSPPPQPPPPPTGRIASVSTEHFINKFSPNHLYGRIDECRARTKQRLLRRF